MSTVWGEISEADPSVLLVGVDGSAYDKNQTADVLRAITPAVNPTDNPDVMAMPLSWAAVTQLAHAFTGQQRWDGTALTWVPGPKLCEWLILEIMRRSCEGDFTGREPLMTPMKHQRAGAVAVGMNGRFMFADDMGTGKGGSYFMSLEELRARGRDPFPAVVVTPANVVDTLIEEIPLWYPDWTAVAYRGPKRQRYLKSNAQILVMGYESMRIDTGDSHKPGPLLKFRPHTVVYDEVHHLCNFHSIQSREARILARHTPNFIAGSGTPITKNAAGFWPLLNSMSPEAYPARERFKNHFFLSRGKPAYGNGDAEIVGLDPARDGEFRVCMQGVFRRVALDDVRDMPPKTYQARYVEVPKEWRAAYDQMEADMLAELPGQLTPLEANVAIVKMMRLRQLACSACDVQVTREIENNPRSPKFGMEVEHVSVTLKEPCWKGAALVDLLREIHQGEGELDELGGQHGHAVGSRPVLAFAESSQLIRLAGAMAEKKGYVTAYIDGDVPQAERTEIRGRFQANELDLLCLTTGTGGTGLNLTAAGDVAFLAPSWGYVPTVQAERRAWRTGQTKPVKIYNFVAKNTVESRVFTALRDKAGNLADLMMDRRIAESFLGGGDAT